MMRVLGTLATIVVAALMAFACDHDPNPVKDQGPDAPACTVTSSTGAKDACTRFKEALCLRSRECEMFPTIAACEARFTETYGDCAKADTKPALTATEDAAFVECLCTLPIASCRSLEEQGVEISVPDCGKF